MRFQRQTPNPELSPRDPLGAVVASKLSSPLQCNHNHSIILTSLKSLFLQEELISKLTISSLFRCCEL